MRKIWWRSHIAIHFLQQIGGGYGIYSNFRDASTLSEIRGEGLSLPISAKQIQGEVLLDTSRYVKHCKGWDTCQRLSASLSVLSHFGSTSKEPKGHGVSS